MNFDSFNSEIVYCVGNEVELELKGMEGVSGEHYMKINHKGHMERGEGLAVEYVVS